MKNKITNRQIKVLAFCEVPRRALEVADHLGILLASAYPYLGKLIRQGLLSSGPSTNEFYKLKMFHTLRPGNAVVHKITPKTKALPEDQTIWNTDLMKAAHNPFRIGKNG